MNKSRKSSGNNSKDNANSFHSLKSKILSDIENDSSQSENFVSEPLDKEIQLVGNINDKINNNDISDNYDSDYDDDDSSNNYDDDFYYNNDDDDDDYNDDYFDHDDDSNSNINNDEYDDSHKNIDSYNDDFIDDNDSALDGELLSVYVGKNYDKLVSSSFNIFGFLFTMFYMLYRKMYGYSLIIFIILITEMFFVKSLVIILITYLVLAIIIGFTINKIYISFARRKVNKIKLKNTNLHYGQLRDVCSLNGGTSLRGVFSIILIGIICIFGILFAVGGPNFNLKENLNKIFNKDKDNDKDKSHENEEYRGFISYDSKIKIKDEFSISVPDSFIDESSTYSYYYKYYAENDIFGSCRLKFGSVLGYSDSNHLISKMIKYYSKTYKIDSSVSGNKSNINNIEWTWFFYKTSSSTRYFYSTVKDKKIYLFSYEIDDNTILDECENFKMNILNSIESK